MIVTIYIIYVYKFSFFRFPLQNFAGISFVGQHSLQKDFFVCKTLIVILHLMCKNVKIGDVIANYVGKCWLIENRLLLLHRNNSFNLVTWRHRFMAWLSILVRIVRKCWMPSLWRE